MELKSQTRSFETEAIAYSRLVDAEGVERRVPQPGSSREPKALMSRTQTSYHRARSQATGSPGHTVS